MTKLEQYKVIFADEELIPDYELGMRMRTTCIIDDLLEINLMPANDTIR
ncbi:MAG: hypothetical protein JW801_00670 [Bacteroidales bacterium]|nr:hypothetical protein [Bacteroidales bacterium]